MCVAKSITVGVIVGISLGGHGAEGVYVGLELRLLDIRLSLTMHNRTFITRAYPVRIQTRLT